MTTKIIDLTIVSITYNNNGIQNTIDSVLPILNAGGKMVIQNGGRELKVNHMGIAVHNEKDLGIYDAINKGISQVKTKFFMLLHAGDTFVGSVHDLKTIILKLEKSQKSISLNSQHIGSRLHSSSKWRPWMLHFGVQPPHLPTIYRSETFVSERYSINIPIIADFDFFYRNIAWKNAQWDNKLLVKMETGGVTSGGIRSFAIVSRCFIQTYGRKGVMMTLARIPFKLLQSIK